MRVPEEMYEFGDGTYDRLDAAGVSALSVSAMAPTTGWTPPE
jgi:hypothetical protein